jgi:hypothetical protein
MTSKKKKKYQKVKQKGDTGTNRGKREKRIENKKTDLNSETGI